jgi:DNA-binding NtrC family response regulator
MTMGDTILIIHRDLEIARSIAIWLSNAGWETLITPCRESWTSSEPSILPSIVIAESRPIQGDTALLVATMREQSPKCRVIALVSPEHRRGMATELDGLHACLTEPVEQMDLLATVSQALQKGDNWEPNLSSPQETKYLRSPASRGLYERAARLAARDGTVLLLGESGTGKDHLARWIHKNSPRRHGPFFTINCAALSRELAESELFGHEPGAFTGTKGRKRGLLELANQGTLLLNEVGELEPALQAKLLTFLDSRTFVRVGGEKTISVSARLLAATNRDLLVEVEQGTFRRDLYYRLAVVPLYVPPLRERIEDLPLLVEELLASLHRDLDLPRTPSLDNGLMAVLQAYHWPGNIRELRNVIERALVLSVDSVARQEHLELERGAHEWKLFVRFPPQGVNLHELTRDVAKRLVTEALRRATNKQEAARLLGISRHSLAHQLRTLGIDSGKRSLEPPPSPEVPTNWLPPVS